jgi:DNA-binding transcriptional LysR family regulator
VISLDHLRTFVTVFRSGSLTEAASLLGVSQPTVSAHVQALEAAFGFALFVRNRTGVSATAKGSELARELATHVDALDDIAAISTIADSGPRAIHIGGPAELLGEMIIPRVRDLAKAAGAPLWFTFGLADDLLEELRTGSLDIVVSAVPPRVAGVAATPLYDEEFVLVGAPQWVDTAHLEPQDLTDRWARIPVVAYAGNLPIVRRYWRSVFGRRPDDLQLALVVPDLRGIRLALLAGTGMSVLPHYLVADDLASGVLVQLHLPEVAPLNTVYLATRNGEGHRTPRLRAVMEELERLIR